MRKESIEEFWALNDVSFDVQPGESVGIIGGTGGQINLVEGSFRITRPTCGKIVVRGRIASLLEVGTGFHPELTGRGECLFQRLLSGMKRGEIKGKFDEIVELWGEEIFRHSAQALLKWYAAAAGIFGSCFS